MLLVTTLISWLTTYNGAQRRLRAIDNYNKSRYDYNLFIVLFPQKLFLNKFPENNRVFIQPAPSIDEAFKSE